MRRGERVHVAMGQADRADDLVVPEHRHRHDASRASRLEVRSSLGSEAGQRGSASTSATRTRRRVLIAWQATLAAVTGFGHVARHCPSCSGVYPSCATEWTSSPSKRYTPPLRAPHRRTAFFTIASKTGCTSVCAWLMARRISAVAVCRSSASPRSLFRDLSSSNSLTFSMAITAWLANVSSSAISASVNGRTSARRTAREPSGPRSLNRGISATLWMVLSFRSSSESGNSLSATSCASSMMTRLRSRMARPPGNPG